MSDITQIGRATSAPKTSYVHARVDAPGGMHLFIDGNQKISGFDDPKPNAFSIVQVDDCPYRTPSCESSCYAHQIEKHVPDLHAMYRHNSAAIRKILGSDLEVGWIDHLAKWISENCEDRGFRWHVSGDVYSAEYADFIATVCTYSTGVAHWIYTRSFPYLEQLVEVSTVNGGNLAINLSADRDNYWLARRFAETYGLRVCYMVTSMDDRPPPDMREGDVLFPDYSLRGAVGLSPTEQRDASPWWQSLTGAQQHMTCPTDFYSKAAGTVCGPCRKCLD